MKERLLGYKGGIVVLDESRAVQNGVCGTVDEVDGEMGRILESQLCISIAAVVRKLITSSHWRGGIMTFDISWSSNDDIRRSFGIVVASWIHGTIVDRCK